MIMQEIGDFNQKEVQTTASLKEQVDQMDILFSKGLYWEITPDKFPCLPVEKVALSRFWATDNAIDGLQNARVVAKDPQLKRKLAVMISILIKQRDSALSDSLGNIEGDIDEELMTKQQNFRQPGEFTRMLEMTLGLGLVDQVDEKNFPALRALGEKEKMFLRLQSMHSRRYHLKAMENDQKDFGYKNNTKKHDTRRALQLSIEELDRDYADLLKRYLASD